MILPELPTTNSIKEVQGLEPSPLHAFGALTLQRFGYGFMIDQPVTLTIKGEPRTIKAETYLDVCAEHAMPVLMGVMIEIDTYGPDKFPAGHEKYSKALAYGQHLVTTYMGDDIARVLESKPGLDR